MTKKEFGERLRRLMVAKGWHHSELARQAGLPRNNISTYINGRSFPSELSLRKLAKVLGITPEELFPNRQESGIRGGQRPPEPQPELAMHSLGNGEAMLHINKAMPLEKAMRCLAIASE